MLIADAKLFWVHPRMAPSGREVPTQRKKFTFAMADSAAPP